MATTFENEDLSIGSAGLIKGGKLVFVVTRCEDNHTYVASFYGPDAADNAVRFLEPRGMTHAYYLDEDESDGTLFNQALSDLLYPQCHHGMSLWLCADPVNHYPTNM